MLNQDMDEVVLVKGWKKGANWSFPRGKINKDEKDLDCAVREVYEETGFDINQAGLVKDEKDVKFIEITMREQHMRLYVFRGVPRDSHFEPRTRKEISKIEWYKLSDLPTLKKSKQNEQGFAVANANKFYMVAPFMHPLKKWIAQQKKLDPKVPADVKQGLHAELSMDENNGGYTPLQPAVGMVPPSDLPEVASHDASSHLKRLLNINNGVAAPDQMPDSKPVTASGLDDGKSNALLALLRNGSSHDAVPQLHNDVPPPFANQVGARQQPYPAPGFFPGFPRQTGQSQPAEQGDFLPIHPQPLRGPLPQVPPVNPLDDRNQQHRPLDHGVLPAGQPAPSLGYGPPQFPPLHVQPYQSGPRTTPPSFPPPPSHAPAPFQRTGDPQFSHSAQPTQVQRAAVPPASKLPPPKLTEHSLGLLNVLRDEAPKAPKGPDASMLEPEKEQMERRRPSQHQDQLLNLLKGPNASIAGPAELSAQPTSPAAKKILRRPQADGNNKHQDARRTPSGEGQTSATVSGPLNMPQFEAIGKPHSKKKPNGNRKANKDRQPQAPASPITILPRPQTTKGESSPTKLPALDSSTHPQAPKAKIAEAPKTFQPKILRRTEKPEPDQSLPVRTKAREVDTEHEVNPRRPSQTAAQKEALLSLFGKQTSPASMSPAGKIDVQTSAAKSSASTIVSPLSPVNLTGQVPANSVSPENASQISTGNRVASPVDKAFLLGFLEGVAKGNK